MNAMELLELIYTVRTPNLVVDVRTVNRLLDTVQPFVSASVRVHERSRGYWRRETRAGTDDPRDASTYPLFDAWHVANTLVLSGTLSFELVLPPRPDHRPRDLEAVDRAARRFAELQNWEWDKLDNTTDTLVPGDDRTPDRATWSRNRIRDAVYQSIRLYREEETR